MAISRDSSAMRCGAVELGVGRVQLADAVVEVGERGVVLLAVLADVEGRQAEADGAAPCG